MSEEQKQNDGAIWAEVSALKTSSAAQSTDIRGIYGALEEIRDALVRFQENARPNIGAMFLVLIATCTFLVTAGGLALAPVYREQGRTYDTLVHVIQSQNDIRDRFEDRVLDSERGIYANDARLARIEGMLQLEIRNRRLK